MGNKTSRIPLTQPHISIAEVIKKYAPLALIMDDFYQKLQKESKNTPYPANSLENELNTIKKKSLKTGLLI